MNYTLHAYPQFTQSKIHFGKDAQSWIAALGDVPEHLPPFLAKILRNECIDAQWFEGTLALERAMKNNPAHTLLWSGCSPKNDSVLLAAIQADDKFLFQHFLRTAEFDLTRDVFLGVAPQYSPTLKREHLSEMLEKLAEKMMQAEKPMAKWLATESNKDLLEQTLAFAQLDSLWQICEPYTSFENKWQRVCATLLKAENEKTYFHASNSLNKQFVGMWHARPDLKRLTPDLKKMVANHLVFSDIAAAVSKESLEKGLENTSNILRTRKL